jgi:hypothetical protein
LTVNEIRRLWLSWHPPNLEHSMSLPGRYDADDIKPARDAATTNEDDEITNCGWSIWW